MGYNYSNFLACIIYITFSELLANINDRFNHSISDRIKKLKISNPYKLRLFITVFEYCNKDQFIIFNVYLKYF
jgi:hypothetical protein